MAAFLVRAKPSQRCRGDERSRCDGDGIEAVAVAVGPEPLESPGHERRAEIPRAL